MNPTCSLQLTLANKTPIFSTTKYLAVTVTYLQQSYPHLKTGFIAHSEKKCADKGHDGYGRGSKGDTDHM